MLFKTFIAYLFFSLNLILFFSSCNGLNQSNHSNTTILKGQTVATLGKGNFIIFQDKKNNYWFAGDGKGVYKYNGKSLVLFTTKDGLCSPSILGIQEDKLGNIYFDTPHGVSEFDGQNFTTLEVFTSENSQNKWQLQPDDLWFSMGWYSNGPYRYDGNHLYQLTFPKPMQADTFYAHYPNASFNPYGIYTIYKDRSGMLWFGTASLGVCRYDGTSINWLYEEQLTTTPNGGAFGIRSIFEDNAGDFWFTNTRYRYHISSERSIQNELIVYNKETGVGYSDQHNKITFPYCMSMTTDNDGNLWMVSTDKIWRKEGNNLIDYPVENKTTDMTLFSIYKDHKSTLWLGTHNAGIYTFNGHTFEQFKL